MEFKSAQRLAIEQAIEEETVRQVKLQAARMRFEQFEREKKAHRAELRDRAVKALAEVERHGDIPPHLKKKVATVGLDILQNKKSKRAQAIELENLQNAINEF